MLKFKRKKAISGRVFHKMTKNLFLPLGELKDTYPYRKIMCVRAKRLDIRIKCHSCRMNFSYLRMVTSDLHLDIKGYKPFDRFTCGECKGYMRGGLYL